VRQPGAVMVAFMFEKHLCLVFQPPEGRGMDDPVTVTLELASGG
jgi:hypothetical protein